MMIYEKLKKIINFENKKRKSFEPPFHRLADLRKTRHGVGCAETLIRRNDYMSSKT